MAFRALGDLVHPLGEILLAIEDHVPCAGLLGQRRLFRCAYAADHGCAKRLAPLAQDEPNPAGRRVDQDRVALFDAMGLAHEILRGEALEHHRRGGVIGNRSRQLEQEPGFDVALFGIRARGAGVGDAVPGLKPCTDGPTATTSPAPSEPGVYGVFAGG